MPCSWDLQQSATDREATAHHHTRLGSEPPTFWWETQPSIYMKDSKIESQVWSRRTDDGSEVPITLGSHFFLQFPLSLRPRAETSFTLSFLRPLQRFYFPFKADLGLNSEREADLTLRTETVPLISSAPSSVGCLYTHFCGFCNLSQHVPQQVALIMFSNSEVQFKSQRPCVTRTADTACLVREPTVSAQHLETEQIFSFKLLTTCTETALCPKS